MGFTYYVQYTNLSGQNGLSFCWDEEVFDSMIERLESEGCEIVETRVDTD